MESTEQNFLDVVGFSSEQIEKLLRKDDEQEYDKDYTIIDFLNSIGQTGEDLLREPHDSEYTRRRYKEYRYGILSYFSRFPDCIFLVNEVNCRDLPTELEYHYLRLSLSKKKRYSKKIPKDKDEKALSIMAHYGYSYAKAKEVEDLL